MNTVLTILVVILSISLVVSSSIPQFVPPLLILLISLQPVAVTCSLEKKGNDEDDEGSFLNVLDNYKTASKRQALTRNYYNDYAYYYKRNCKRWNDWCDPWSSNPSRTCCKNERLACKCNFFGSNCRCTRKLWGR